MGRTFSVSNVEPAAQRCDPLNRAQALSSLVRSRVEQMWTSDARLVSCTDVHPLVHMAHDAFYEHRPIVLSPDAVWFCLAQGFAQHVNLHAERLRKRFVRHEGKLKLVVERLDFALGRSNPWPEVFAAFDERSFEEAVALHPDEEGARAGGRHRQLSETTLPSKPALRSSTGHGRGVGGADGRLGGGPAFSPRLVRRRQRPPSLAEAMRISA